MILSVFPGELNGFPFLASLTRQEGPKKKQVIRCVSDHLLSAPVGVAAISVANGRPLHSPVFESALGPSSLSRDTSSRPGHLLFSNQVTRFIVFSMTSARSNAV